MGKPRMIILIRHAQSEGNKNRDIHQFIPDHRVKLTQHGWTQADEAGRKLRALLKPDDTIQFFTSPYRRTRETTEGILRTLVSDDPTPSPFQRSNIKVYEEPRLREQDFGNFQPCSAEMERMWQERADYGHFFYRIPDGESAADAYDRVSGFNESLWRQFGDDDFPSVCVLVTHGLMSRVFLMKWYHWSVEYFEDLRNVNHCEFIIMKRSDANAKYILQNELRTWSELKRRAAASGAGNISATTPSRSTPVNTVGSSTATSSPVIPVRRWGGCVNGCDHDKVHWPRRAMRKNTADFFGSQQQQQQLPPPAVADDEQEDPVTPQDEDTPIIKEPVPAKLSRKSSAKNIPATAMPQTPASPNDASNDATSSEEDKQRSQPTLKTAAVLRHLQSAERGHGDGLSDDSDYFPGMHHQQTTSGKSRLRASSKQRHHSKERKLHKRMTEQSWKEESGMGSGTRTDRLGDGDGTSDEVRKGGEGDILREALKGDMIVEKSEEDGDEEDEGLDVGDMTEKEVERLKEAEKKGFGEVY
ncbi:phosphoglycerate mutase-like protein [Dothidotthia symphoricarpi CBS 119687]|uniref:Phosphoglycerate mutase-like protein n=1 Tax=Dothidotthia symphoricarpi CBS 119687 TaxID=1392245 RepID=A0A6A6ARJ0_9PLEO|nr:phosphoglycerate mutase-like protein [Dothidotthia symphoricarpi CBS 119687]KAF2133823.1 phosphoglycerate mutase-like protein [Dothidotthia symphoricarpi CBS 119687]